MDDFEDIIKDREVMREVKECPSCHTQQFVDLDQCYNCGHRFQTQLLQGKIAKQNGRHKLLFIQAGKQFELELDTPITISITP